MPTCCRAVGRPLYLKYNAVLRGIVQVEPNDHTKLKKGGNEKLAGDFKKYCSSKKHGGSEFNTYKTTIHCINSAVVRSSRANPNGAAFTVHPIDGRSRCPS